MIYMDMPGVRQVPEGSGEQEKMEKTGCKIICGAPTTLAVKGLMMMMMMMIMMMMMMMMMMTALQLSHDGGLGGVERTYVRVRSHWETVTHSSWLGELLSKRGKSAVRLGSK